MAKKEKKKKLSIAEMENKQYAEKRKRRGQGDYVPDGKGPSGPADGGSRKPGDPVEPAKSKPKKKPSKKAGKKKKKTRRK